MSRKEHISKQDSTPKKTFLDLSDEDLMAYTEGTLSQEEQRAIEELIDENSPDADALEGLQMLAPAETKRQVAELHRQLHHQLLRKHGKGPGKKNEDFWNWIAVVIILLLIAVGYIVIRLAA